MNKRMKEKMNNLELVTAAGGVVFRGGSGRQEVLLILKEDRWDLPKGMQEKDESLRDCAVREVEEETGIRNLIIENFLTQTIHSYKRGGQSYRKTTYWFRMRCSGQETFLPQKEEGIEQVRWTPVDKAQRKLAYKNLREVLRPFQQMH